MTIKSRKKIFGKITKEAEDKNLLKKIAQEVESTSSSPDEYAKNFLKKVLEQTDIHLVGEDEGSDI